VWSEDGWHCRLLTDLDVFETEPYASGYADFLDDLPDGPRLFYSLPWLRAVEPLFGSPFFLTLWNGERIRALLPLCRRRARRARIRLSQLARWGVDDSRYLEYPGPLLCVGGSPGVRDAAAGVAVRALLALRGHFDEIELNRVEPQDDFVVELERAFPLRLHGWSAVWYLFMNHDCIDQRLGSANLRRIRRAKERLEEDFESVEWTFATSVNDTLFGELAALHRERQARLRLDGRARKDPFGDVVETRAVRTLLDIAHDRNKLRVYQLRVENRLVSFFICFCDGSYTRLELTASREVPGHKYAVRTLMYFMFNTEWETFGTRCIDHSWGTHQLKSKFSDERRELVNLSFVNDRRLLPRVSYWVRKLQQDDRDPLKVLRRT